MKMGPYMFNRGVDHEVNVMVLFPFSLGDVEVLPAIQTQKQGGYVHFFASS